MTELYHLQGQSKEGEPTKLTIASGPVIIEDGKVLLDKHGDDGLWKLPGGRVADGLSIRENVHKKAKDELSLEIELISQPFIMTIDEKNEGTKEYVLLVHYLAKRINQEIKPADYINEWAWLDINNLPDDCAPNIKAAVKFFSE